MYLDPSGKFVVTTLIICILVGAVVGGAVGGITAANSGQDILTGVLSGAAIGGAVGAVFGLGSAAIVSGLASLGTKFASDLIALGTFGKEFCSWEDYAIAFAFGGLAKGLHLSLGWKFVSDVIIRPGANQLLKTGTRGLSFSFEKYAFDVFVRATSFGLPGDLKPLYRGIMRGYYDYLIKSQSQNGNDQNALLVFDYAY
jgi:hypothetical protein